MELKDMTNAQLIAEFVKIREEIERRRNLSFVIDVNTTKKEQLLFLKIKYGGKENE